MELYLSYAKRGNNRWWHYPLTLLAGLAIATVILVLLSVALTLFRLQPLDLSGQLQRSSDAWAFFLAIAIMFASLCVGLAAAARLIQNKNPGDIIGGWRWRLFMAGAAIWLAVELILSGFDFALDPSGFKVGSHGTMLVALWAFGAILIQTFTEEFIFRGFLTQGLLLLVRRPFPTACASGLIFGAMHIPNGLPQAINAVWFGAVCAFLAIRTGGIALTCGIHLANNYFGAMGVVSTRDVFNGLPGLVIQDTPRLEWWDLATAIVALAILPKLLRRLQLFPGGTNA